MPKQNPYFITENYKKIEEIRMIESDFDKSPQIRQLETEKELLTKEQLAEQQKIETSYYEEFASYNDLGIEKSYGPCNNRKGITIAKLNKKKIKLVGGQHLIDTFNKLGKKNKNVDFWNFDEAALLEEKEGLNARLLNIEGSGGARAGAGGAIADAELGFSLVTLKDDKGDGLRFVNGSVGGEIGAGPGGFTVGYSANLDLANFQVKGLQARIGLDIGSGLTVGLGGVEFKVVGCGLSIGKKTGISAPFGGESIDFEEGCIIL